MSREKIIDSVREFARANVNQRLPEEIVLEEGDFLWEKYYETQFLEQRLNPKLFHRFIPKYALEKAEMKVEKDFLNRLVKKNRGKITLDRFLES